VARPVKLSKEEVQRYIQAAISEDKIVLSEHADKRMSERNISWFEVIEVLRFGHSERRKDEFKKKFGCWNYSMRHDIKISDVEKRCLRIPVAIDDDGTIVVSAIDIDQDDSF
jgi:AraC-like DNA-binding protein